MEKWDDWSGEWLEVPAGLPEGLWDMCAAPLNGTHFIVAGGDADMTSYPGDQVYLFDTVEEAWEELSDLTVSR